MKSEGEGWKITNDAQIDWNYFERVVLTDRMCCKCTVILIELELIQKLKRAEPCLAGANETLVFTLNLIVREDDMKDE
mgnify:CR=1 FL=1